MEKEKFVVLVEIPDNLAYNKRPHVLDYANENIVHIQPCKKVSDQFFDVRSGEPVQKKANHLIWPSQTGTVFAYPDGKNILLSRRYADGKLITCEINPKWGFHPSTMVLRKVI
ncbi:MAG: hypothetical protein IJ824_05590 [Alphaproteobacteria bacterium]|nr:hypothetical protein [Alphaproteobacteria bacterium]